MAWEGANRTHPRVPDWDSYTRTVLTVPASQSGPGEGQLPTDAHQCCTPGSPRLGRKYGCRVDVATEGGRSKRWMDGEGTGAARPRVPDWDSCTPTVLTAPACHDST